MEAGQEGARGEEAGAVAPAEAAPLAGPRGRTAGWGCNRASCWRWWQRVLLVMLVWLVVPAEAAGAAQAAGGAVAAVAAAAVAANTVLNYWAVSEGDTAGDLQVLGKGPGVIRIMSTNLRRVKRDETGQDMSKVVWKETMRAVEDAAVDIWAAQDTGVEDGGAPGQAALWSAGRLKREMEFSWGGMKLGWTHQQGHKGKMGIRRGGTFLAVQEKWRAEMHKVKADSRGWGRYVMREMLGKSGASMVVVSLYLPTKSGAREPGGGAWDWQVQQMVNLRTRLQRTREGGKLDKHSRKVLGHLEQLDTQEVGGSGGAATPVSLALLDLAADLDKVQAEYEVVVGDWNVRHPDGTPHSQAAGRRNTAVVRRFAQSRGLVDPLKERLGKEEVEPRTYFSGETETWIDYYLVSKSLVDRGLVRAAGVLAEPVNESDHRPVVLDIDAATALGTSRLWDDIRQAQKESDLSCRNSRFKAVQLGKVGRVKAYQQAVLAKWPKGGQLCQKIAAFSNRVSEMGSQAWKDSGVEVALVKEGDQLMAEALGAVLAGQEEVHSGLPKVGKRSSGSQRKHQTSPAYLRQAQEMRMALRLARNIREGRKVGWLIARRLKMKGMGIQLPCLPYDGEGMGTKGWREYASVLEKRARGLRSGLHCDLRQQMKTQRAGRGVRLTRMMEPASEEGGGREGAALTNAQRKSRDGAVDSAVIREEADEAGGPSKVRAATSGEEVKTSTLEYLKQWMGWGRSFWFHSPDGRTPAEPMGGGAVAREWRPQHLPGQ